MSENPNQLQRINQLLSSYGEGPGSPSAAQWQALLDRPADGPITLLNFFKLREQAEYPQSAKEAELALTGQEAFSKYSEVSIPTMQGVGGQFLLVAPFEGMYVGENEDWDLIAVGSYPDTKTLFKLIDDENYQRVYRHRIAACARQKVFIASS